MLKKDKERLKYKDGTDEMSALDKRINSLINEDVQYLKEYGDDYFKSGTGLFGRLGRSLGDSGEGRRVFNEIRQVNNQMGNVYSNQELLNMINNKYQEENLKYKISSDILPKEKRTQKAAGGLQNPEKADLDKDGEISSYEEARGKAIEESIREQKQEGGEAKKTVTLDTVLFKNDKVRKATVRSLLSSSRPEEVFGYMETGNIEFLRSGVEDYANQGRPDAYTYIYPPGEMPDDVAKARLERLNSIIRSGYKINRTKKVEGGPMSIDDQMKMAMNMSEESTMPPEQDMQPDEEMEDDYVDYVVSQSLDQDEEEFLMKELEGNPQLSMIFDKVMETASEFSGSGPIEGPGTEVSDSIPARLSDGEFVFTAKAVDVIGADNLMSLMKQAEAKADERLPAQEGGAIREEMQQQAGFAQPQETTQNIRVTKETVDPSAMVQEESDLTGDEIRSQMMLDPYQRHVRS